MPNNGYFDNKRDNELIAAGAHFWCNACLIARPLDDQSPDKRYCFGCYNFLLKEAEMLSPKQGRPQWLPQAGELTKKTADVSGHTPLIMSTLESKEIKVDIIQSSVSARPIVKRGPKHRDLPEGLIRQLANEGMGAKAIATRLTGEGVTVSYKTIQRLLSGQRKSRFR